MDLDLAQLRALNAAVSTGSLDGAARLLHLTPSAVSQRLRALEVATGRVLLVRSRPVRPTPSGEVVLRLARQIELLADDTLVALGTAITGDDGVLTPRPPTLALAVNADSLATWALPALAPLADEVCLELHRDDEEHTTALLRDGTVVAAVTTDPDPLPGCSVTRLGTMRYRPMVAPRAARRWFPDGPTPAALARAPVVVFDAKDDLQHRWLRSRLPGGEDADPPTHQVPSSAEFRSAVRLGLGWGMLPDLHRADDEAAGHLVVLDPDAFVDVTLHWQQWKLRSPALDRVGEALTTAARRLLLP
ncbi:LysR family transcriptional regulator ArgP [Cellulomonas marina]|uniref:LysR family transcriptional regulator, chromosome initiation inhibitor n=1 Tax=Cellulomonas marina TaxID=988821 RepID=A0A1I0V4Y0_9CELL|nr:LysR family transcriptional regulator ArgP [Cellulomonas marina]GIG28325.1 transcriptional regulator ArgP [Cellulomonas marina]SFA71140.1 LysR family transcriptional regulator, chromosome initiation inhibitor [Cellulomonas marina]